MGIDDYQNELTAPEDIEEQLIIKETFDFVMEKAKKVLSDFELKVLDLFLQDYTYSEIAEKLGKPKKTCDNALQRIKKKLSEEN